MNGTRKSDNIIKALPTPDLSGKSKKKVLVVNTSLSPTVVNSDGQAIGGHRRAYVSLKDPVAKGAIETGLLRVLSE